MAFGIFRSNDPTEREATAQALEARDAAQAELARLRNDVRDVISRNGRALGATRGQINDVLSGLGLTESGQAQQSARESAYEAPPARETQDVSVVVTMDVPRGQSAAQALSALPPATVVARVNDGLRQVGVNDAHADSVRIA